MVAPLNVAKKLEKYIPNLHDFLDNDFRDIVEIRHIKSKKREIITALSSTIERMMYMNYSIKDQVQILNENIPMFSMTIETYRKHVTDVLGEDIMRMHRINGILAHKIIKIKKARKIFKSIEKQFDYLELEKIEVYDNDLITIDDYIIFIDIYESANKKTTNKKAAKPIKSYDSNKNVIIQTKKTIKPNPIEEIKNEHIKEDSGLDEVEVIKTKPEQKPLNKQKVLDNTLVIEEKSLFEVENTNINTAATIDVQIQDDKFLKDDFKISVVQDDVNNIKSRIIIEYDNSKIPGELNELIEYSEDRNSIKERYSYFNNDLIFQICDYVPVHNELVIIGTGRNTKAFRYESKVNTLYYFRDFKGHIGFSRKFDQWTKKHQTKEYFLALSKTLDFNS